MLSTFAAPGCALLNPAPDTGMGRLSSHAVRLKLVFEAQTAPDLCGVASVDMLTAYFKRPLSPGAILGLKAEADSTGGVSGASLKQVLEEDGYRVAVFPGSLDHGTSGLFRQLDSKLPLIVMTGLKPRHYFVVAGYDETKSMLVLLDPARGQIAVDIQKFSPLWKDANNFTLLAVPNRN